MYPAESITHGSPVRQSSGRLSLLSAAVSAVFALMLSVSGVQGQDLGPFNELLAGEQVIGRWVGQLPECLGFPEPEREIVIRRDGFVSGLYAFEQVKWALSTMLWDGESRLTLTFWTRVTNENGKTVWSKCYEGVDVSSKSLRFLDKAGITYARMRRAD